MRPQSGVLATRLRYLAPNPARRAPMQRGALMKPCTPSNFPAAAGLAVPARPVERSAPTPHKIIIFAPEAHGPNPVRTSHERHHPLHV